MSDWQTVNLNLIAKSIGELCYEQILTAVKLSDNEYAIDLQSGDRYTFKAWMGIWDHKVNRSVIGGTMRVESDHGLC